MDGNIIKINAKNWKAKKVKVYWTKLMATKLRSIQKNYGLWNKMDRNNVKVYAKIEVQINYGLWNRKDGNKVRVNAKIKGQKS